MNHAYRTLTVRAHLFVMGAAVAAVLALRIVLGG